MTQYDSRCSRVDWVNPPSAGGSSAFDVAYGAARAAGSVLLEHFRRATTVRWKGKSNIATEAAILAEQAITAVLHREYPEHGVLGEESGRTGDGAEYTWLVDPLDGTNNFLFGVPFFCVTLALVRGDEVLLGVTYDPLREELFHAERGKRPRLNGAEISVSSRRVLDRSLVGFDIGYDPQEGQEMLRLVAKLWPRVHSMRLLGSAALGLAYVAAGRMDVYCHRSLYPWDIASGLLLVRTAGGIVTDWEGATANPNTCRIVAGGKAIHKEFGEWHQQQEAPVGQPR